MATRRMLRILAATVLAVVMTISANGQNRDQALITAAGKGDLAVVERLVREGASVSAASPRVARRARSFRLSVMQTPRIWGQI